MLVWSFRFVWGLELGVAWGHSNSPRDEPPLWELRGPAATSEGGVASNWIHWARRPAMKKPLLLFPLLAVFAGACLLSAQSPTGPITPQLGTPIQQAPPQSKIVRAVTLVNT